MLIVDIIDNYLNKKSIDRLYGNKTFINADGEKISKSLKILGDNIIKYSSQISNLEFDVVNFICGKYNEIMCYDFKIYRFDKNSIICHKKVKQSIMQWFVSKKRLFNKTKELLELYVKNSHSLLYKLKKENSNVDNIKVFVGNGWTDRNNYFVFKNNYYLLDLEDFYFIMYDKNKDTINKKDIVFSYELRDYTGGTKKLKLKNTYTIKIYVYKC